MSTLKVPNPRQLPSGSWYIQLRLGGQSYPVTKDSKAECIKAAQLIKAEYQSGKIKPVKSEVTLISVIDKYIAKYEKVLSPATIRGYYVIRRNRFLDYRDKPITKIDWQEMINDELSIVGEKTVKNSWGLVTAALRDRDLPVPNVKLAKVPVKEIAFLQPEEIKPFLSAMEGDLAELPALFMLHSLRFSEVLALTWNDIDVKRGKIHVRGAVVLDKDNKLTRKETNKNATSRRTVDIMIPRLKALLEAAETKEGPVTTLFNTTVYHHVQAACRRAGVTVVGNHGLRHSFASLAYDLGWSEQMLMDFGGWANPSTVHKIYVRISNSRKSKNINSMAQFYNKIG